MLLRTIKLEEEALIWIEMPGEIFIRLLKLTILPLISANVVIVSSTLNAKENGKISLVALAFIISSNVLAAVSGVVVCLLLKPGASNLENGPDSNQTYTPEHHLRTSSIFADLLYNLFPDNVIGVTLYQSRTTYQIISKLAAGNSSKLLKRTITNVSSMNMLGLLFCSFIFGAAAGKAGERGKVFLDFFRSVADVVLKIMNLFLLFTPIGVCFMIAGPIAAIQNPTGAFSQLGLFAGTVTLGLLMHLSVMFLLYTLITRANPFRLLPYCFRTWLISITTLSPIITIPELFKASDAYGIDRSLSRFVVPLSATLKGDGSAVFIAASTLFIAQLTQTTVTAGTITIVCLLSSSAVLAIPNIPSSSIVILVTILSSLGIPANHVGLLFALEWLLDRLRSTNLAVLHMYCVALTQYVCKGKPTPPKDQTDDLQSSSHAVSKTGEDKVASEMSELLNGDVSLSA
ncbi:hypothetical protein SprV_0100107500 [Sparganum proliferum]